MLIFFCKRNKLLCEIVSSNVMEASKRSPLLDLCKTRWAARHVAYQHFYQCFEFLVLAYEVIAFDWHKDSLSVNFSTATWDPESKNTANSLLKGIADFEFIVAFLIMYQFLSHLSGITIKLLSTSWDIIRGDR